MQYSECHGHIAFGENSIKEKILALKEAGILYFRDGGDAEGIGAKEKAQIKDSGIEFASPVFAIYKEGLYGSYLGRPYTDMKSFELLVKEAKLQGADFIKLIFSGIASFKEPGKIIGGCVPEDEIREMIKIAHSEGFSVMAHCNGVQTIKFAIDAGTDSLEHGIFIDDEGIDMLSKSDCIWVPTAAAITNDKLQLQHKSSIEKAHGLGVKIAGGSDSGAKGCEIGKNTQKEYEILLSCGITENEIESSNNLIKSRFVKR